MVKKPKTKESAFFHLLMEYSKQMEELGTFDEEKYQFLRAELDKIAKTNVQFADSRRAFMATISRKKKDYEDAIKNLKATNNFADARAEEYIHILNDGYASEAFAIAPKVLDERHFNQDRDVFKAIVSNGGFQLVNEYVLNAQNRQEFIKPRQLFVIVQEVVQVMKQLGVSDLDIVRMNDVVGEILRETNDLFVWPGATAEISTLTDENGVQLLIEYFVPVTPSVAAKMSWDLVERLVDREIDKPGVSLNFLGIAA